MKKIVLNSVFVSLLFISTVSCKTDFEQDVADINITQGQADFSKYIALGNSLTSGYRDNALYLKGQQESYPLIIAQQMKLAGGGEFKQPLMNDNLGGIPSVKIGNKLVLAMVNGSLTPVQADGTGTTTLNTIYNEGPYQNLGVPGAKSFHLGLNGFGSAANLALKKANPYFVRFASSANSSVLEDAISQSPTFFSLWIGNNDVLSYATSGGMGKDQTGNPDPSTYSENDITDPTVFAGVIGQYVTALTANGAKGVIANIPNVTSIPFFTTVPHNPLTVSQLGAGDENVGKATINQLNEKLYGPLKQALTAFGAGDRLQLLSISEPNPLLIYDASLPDLSTQLKAALSPKFGEATATALGKIFGQARQAASSDYILLTTKAVIGQVAPNAPQNINRFGISYPLQNEHVLTKDETAKIITATDAFNAAIKNIAQSKGLAFVDANAKLVELNSNSGIQWNGVTYSATFVTGGSFSLDGIHLTGRGYAIIANEFIKAINNKYNSNLPLVNANSYSGVTFPK